MDNKKNMGYESDRGARAKRVAILRGMSCLTRREMAQRYHIPEGNFQNWEGPRYGGLTENGAKKLTDAAKNEGVYCTVEWLMYGTGNGPTLRPSVLQPSIDQITDEDQLITAMHTLLDQHHQTTLKTIVTDDCMSPTYVAGDYVAGKLFKGKAIHHLVGKDCIVLMNDDKLLLRHLDIGTEPHHYNLTCLNPNAQTPQSIISNVQVLAAAPISWVYRKHELANVSKSCLSIK